MAPFPLGIISSSFSFLLTLTIASCMAYPELIQDQYTLLGRGFPKHNKENHDASRGSRSDDPHGNRNAIYTSLGKNRQITNILSDGDVRSVLEPFGEGEIYQNSSQPKSNFINLENALSCYHSNESISENVVRILKEKIMAVLDEYIPRHLAIKVANYLAFYSSQNRPSAFLFSQKDKEILLESVDKIQEKISNYIATKGPAIIGLYNYLKNTTTPLERIKMSYKFLSSYVKEKDESDMMVTGRQTPFGIVNIIIQFLQDPIVLALLIAFNVSVSNFLLFYFQVCIFSNNLVKKC